MDKDEKPIGFIVLGRSPHPVLCKHTDWVVLERIVHNEQPCLSLTGGCTMFANEDDALAAAQHKPNTDDKGTVAWYENAEFLIVKVFAEPSDKGTPQ